MQDGNLKFENNLKMKNIVFSLVMIIGIVNIMGCKNQAVRFPNYKNTAVYFPLQSPERVLSLGSGLVPNPLDQQLEFNIGVSIGGMYDNSKNWWVTYKVDTSLLAHLTNENNQPLQLLPTKYYSLSPDQKILIPSGSFNGLILVKLDPSFLDDSLAWNGNHYAIPLLITGSNADSILSGNPVVPNPTRTNPNDWNSGQLPKDYVLFGIKYINKYDGAFLHRGIDITYDGNGIPINTTIYHGIYTEQDGIWNLNTQGKNTVVTDGIAENSGNGYAMRLIFTDNNDINKPADGAVKISSVTGSKYAVVGTGTYLTNGDEWGGVKRDAIFLKYQYIDGTKTHQVSDTLVFRNRNLTFQQMNLTYNK